MGRFFVFLAAVALLLAGVEVGASAAPIGCGSVVTQSQKLSANISDCVANPAISIGANDVVLDLNGHTVDGVGIGAGISANGRNNVTVKNGVVKEFITGVFFSNGDKNKATGLRASGLTSAFVLTNATNGLVTGNRAGGSNAIVINGGDLDRLTNNVVTASTNGILLQGGVARATLTGNRVSQAPTGISLDDVAKGRIVANIVRGGNVGITVGSSSSELAVFGNAVSGAGINGIQVISGAVDIAIAGNKVTNNGADGIFVGSLDQGISVEGNTANGNVIFGIELQPQSDDAGGNRAARNGQFSQCSNVICR